MLNFASEKLYKVQSDVCWIEAAESWYWVKMQSPAVNDERMTAWAWWTNEPLKSFDKVADPAAFEQKFFLRLFKVFKSYNYVSFISFPLRNQEMKLSAHPLSLWMFVKTVRLMMIMMMRMRRSKNKVGTSTPLKTQLSMAVIKMCCLRKHNASISRKMLADGIRHTITRTLSFYRRQSEAASCLSLSLSFSSWVTRSFCVWLTVPIRSRCCQPAIGQ